MSESPEAFDIFEALFSGKGRWNRLKFNIYYFFVMFFILFIVYILVYFSNFKLMPSGSDIVAAQMKIQEECAAEGSKAADNPFYMRECIKTKLSSGALQGHLIDHKHLITIYGLSILGSLLMICPIIKRFHDRGKSGWWWFLVPASFIPFLGIFASIWLFVETIFLRGTVGPNDYGPDPLDPDVLDPDLLDE